MNDFLSKPLTLESLQLVLKRWLSEHSLSTATPIALPMKPAPQPQESQPDIQDELASIKDRIQELSALLDEEAGVKSWALFQDDTKQTLMAAKSQLETGDAEQLARSAHRLAGSALMIGARSIAQRSKQLEAVARRGDLNASSQLLGDLDSYVTRVVAKAPT
jgi:HPt (histidine-containing phosphotransfer) domain-containing protein